MFAWNWWLRKTEHWSWLNLVLQQRFHLKVYTFDETDFSNRFVCFSSELYIMSYFMWENEFYMKNLTLTRTKLQVLHSLQNSFTYYFKVLNQFRLNIKLRVVPFCSWVDCGLHCSQSDQQISCSSQNRRRQFEMWFHWSINDIMVATSVCFQQPEASSRFPSQKASCCLCLHRNKLLSAFLIFWSLFVTFLLSLILVWVVYFRQMNYFRNVASV